MGTFHILMGTLLLGASVLSVNAAVERRAFCPDQRALVPHAGQPISHYRDFLTENKITIVSPNFRMNDLEEFLFEYKKFPEHLREEMVKNGASISLVSGNSVMEAPTWNQNLTSTFDGRPQSEIAGAGGSPFANKIQMDMIATMKGHERTMIDYCRRYPKNESCAIPILIPEFKEAPTVIVINKLYPGSTPETKYHGSVNLVLHEHGHALDSIYAGNGISKGTRWRELHNNSEIRAYMKTVCIDPEGLYCLNNSNESFAELFAYYNACNESQAHMRRNAPELADFFETLVPRDETAL